MYDEMQLLKNKKKLKKLKKLKNKNPELVTELQ